VYEAQCPNLTKLAKYPSAYDHRSNYNFCAKSICNPELLVYCLVKRWIQLRLTEPKPSAEQHCGQSKRWEEVKGGGTKGGTRPCTVGFGNPFTQIKAPPNAARIFAISASALRGACPLSVYSLQGPSGPGSSFFIRASGKPPSAPAALRGTRALPARSAPTRGDSASGTDSRSADSSDWGSPPAE